MGRYAVAWPSLHRRGERLTTRERVDGGGTEEYNIETKVGDQPAAAAAWQLKWVAHLHWNKNMSRDAPPEAAHFKRYSEREDKVADRWRVGSDTAALCRRNYPR
jgi:hypothetical protein